MFDLDGTTTHSIIVSVTDAKGIVRSIKINPSLSSDFVNIETTSSETATLKVVDLLGRVILSKKIEASEGTLHTTISISNLPNGVYSVVFENNNGHSVGKFIKQ